MLLVGVCSFRFYTRSTKTRCDKVILFFSNGNQIILLIWRSMTYMYNHILFISSSLIRFFSPPVIGMLLCGNNLEIFTPEKIMEIKNQICSRSHCETSNALPPVFTSAIHTNNRTHVK